MIKKPETTKELRESLKKTKDAMQVMVNQKGQTLFYAALHEFFQKCPEVDYVGWDQFTPYYCDGGPCNFGVNQTSLKFKDEVKLTKIEQRYMEEDRRGFVYPWVSDDDKKEPELQRMVRLSDALSELDGILGEIGEFLEKEFGDGYFVLVDRNLTVEKEEVKHD